MFNNWKLEKCEKSGRLVTLLEVACMVESNLPYVELQKWLTQNVSEMHNSAWEFLHSFPEFIQYTRSATCMKCTSATIGKDGMLYLRYTIVECKETRELNAQLNYDAWKASGKDYLLSTGSSQQYRVYSEFLVKRGVKRSDKLWNHVSACSFIYGVTEEEFRHSLAASNGLAGKWAYFLYNTEPKVSLEEFDKVLVDNIASELCQESTTIPARLWPVDCVYAIDTDVLRKALLCGRSILDILNDSTICDCRLLKERNKPIAYGELKDILFTASAPVYRRVVDNNDIHSFDFIEMEYTLPRLVARQKLLDIIQRNRVDIIRISLERLVTYQKFLAYGISVAFLECTEITFTSRNTVFVRFELKRELR